MTVDELKDNLFAAITGDTPQEPLTPYDLFSPNGDVTARADINRLLNYESRMEATRESPDLIHQYYTDSSTGQPSPAPFHAKGELQLVPSYYNMGKGGGFGPSADYTAFGICLKQTRACSVAELDVVCSVVRSMEDIDMACLEESKRFGSKRVELRHSTTPQRSSSSPECPARRPALVLTAPKLWPSSRPRPSLRPRTPSQPSKGWTDRPRVPLRSQQSLRRIVGSIFSAFSMTLSELLVNGRC